MTLTKTIKILDNKIKGNQTPYDLDRLTAKISALSSGDLTGEDLTYKSDAVELSKFDYSLLRKVVNKGSEKEDKKGLL